MNGTNSEANKRTAFGKIYLSIPTTERREIEKRIVDECLIRARTIDSWCYQKSQRQPSRLVRGNVAKIMNVESSKLFPND